MATITPTLLDISSKQDGSVIRAIWTPVTEADTCAPVQFPQYADKSVQVAGTFGSSSTAVQGTIDGTNFAALTDQGGTTIAITAAGIKQVLQNAYQIKPVTTGGTSQSLTISMIFRLSNPLRH
jgi:hypothetical protein